MAACGRVVHRQDQSGRLGVGGSNPLAPTNHFKHIASVAESAALALGNFRETFAATGAVMSFQPAGIPEAAWLLPSRGLVVPHEFAFAMIRKGLQKDTTQRRSRGPVILTTDEASRFDARAGMRRRRGNGLYRGGRDRDKAPARNCGKKRPFPSNLPMN